MPSKDPDRHRETSRLAMQRYRQRKRAQEGTFTPEGIELLTEIRDKLDIIKFYLETVHDLEPFEEFCERYEQEGHNENNVMPVIPDGNNVIPVIRHNADSVIPDVMPMVQNGADPKLNGPGHNRDNVIPHNSYASRASSSSCLIKKYK
jgi:hypothetical protein